MQVVAYRYDAQGHDWSAMIPGYGGFYIKRYRTQRPDGSWLKGKHARNSEARVWSTHQSKTTLKCLSELHANVAGKLVAVDITARR